jgi:hypothetical protein
MRLLNEGRRGMSHVVRHRESAGMALTRGARTRVDPDVVGRGDVCKAQLEAKR